MPAGAHDAAGDLDRVVAVVSALSVGAGARAQSREPILRIETVSHTAFVCGAAADRQGLLRVIVSEDKTARLSSSPDLTPQGVIRLPVGQDE